MKRLNFILLLGCSFLVGKSTFAATPSKQVVAGPYDTVYGIAYNHGIPTQALIAANKLKHPFTLKDGQVLTIPAPNEHIVGDGQTLEAVADEYGVNVDVLAQENNLQSPSSVTPGTHLTIPPRDTESLAEALKPVSPNISTSSLAPLPLVKSAPAREDHITAAPPTSSNAALPDDLAEELAREKKAAAGQTAPETSSKPMLMGNLASNKAGAPATVKEDVAAIINEPKPKKEAKKQEPSEEIKADKKDAKKEEKKKEVEAKDVSFIWPVEGEVISKFSPGGKNDGINIKVEEDTPVKAAAAGTVMYAGNGLKDFGNLLLIKHKDGWVTAYAHNSKLLVQKGDTVKQGQKIAKSGKKGDAGGPQLHFEIRKVKQPIDPLTKLKS
ncbi:MAG TPA: peptidoglycan DD-metalloendopeptidase family protein [Alphaproteobacteria bacterium]|nr:peptidoglycan DD-metalloendopeptidase family protein [Alphaproteobacteria bacterium]